MTDEEYIRHEFFKARKRYPDDIQSIKVRNVSHPHGGESRWVNLPDHVADLVAAVVALTPEDAEVLTTAIRLGASHSETMARIDRMLLGLDVAPEN